MDGYSLVDVIRIVEQTERAKPIAGNFSCYFELPARRMGSMNLTMVNVSLFVACANGKDVSNGVAVVYYKQHLTPQINLEVRISSVASERLYGCPKRGELSEGQLAGSFAAFDFLESNQRVP
jgi:hypothetical protein